MSYDYQRDNYPNVPLHPRDEDHRSTIEKVAEYVAQYGPEAEEKTRIENPNFDFLNGGPYCDYYHYCRSKNIERLRANSGNVPAALPPANNTAEIDQLNTSIQEHRQHILDSERNLHAQKDSFTSLKEVELNRQVEAAEDQKMQTYIMNSGLNITDFSSVLEQLNASKCSKDAISHTKKWIIDFCLTDQQREVILMYLLNRVKAGSASDSFRLNILYLINDWAHYCQKKNLVNITQMLSRYVPQMYAFAVEMASDPALQPKLEKLTGVWEGHKYFNDNCFKQLRNTSTIYNTAKNAQLAEYSKLSATIDANIQAMYAGYEQQHFNYVNHVNQQIAQLEAKIDTLVRQQQGQYAAPPPSGPPQPLIPGLRRSRFDQQHRSDISQPPPPRFFPSPPKNRSISNIPPPVDQSAWASAPPPQQPTIPDGDDIDGHPFDEEELIPKGMYFELPAGLLVPQVPIESLNYAAIDSKSLRLPPRVPPSQRLLDAMDAFYGVPGSRDGSGWEQNGLADFFGRKLALKGILEEKLSFEKKKLEDIITNKPTESDIQMEKEDQETALNKLIQQKKDESHDARDRSRSNSRSRSRSRSHSRSPRDRRRRSPSSSSRSSRSSSSGSRHSRRRRSSSSSSSRSRSRSVSRSPPRQRFERDRSPTPPSFGKPSFTMPPAPLSADNKGAQLLQKMGWSGRGLGAKETGIVEPISGGEMRDKGEQFRGLGSAPDAYEQFRKMRSSGYHDRNQSAYMDRERERKHYDNY